jgi:hypothetical protein
MYMKLSFTTNIKSLAAALLLAVSIGAIGANTKQTVSQVSSSVSITDDCDYIVTSTKPFADEGIVDIQNTEHAVLILKAVKPSKTIGMLADHVRINGEVAQNGVNCQVKMYSQGCIILPYGDDSKPLTVYSELNFGGDECNDFGLEDSGGFMNTLTDEKLNNRIRSFKLKRGYMVTFSIRPGGYGYSRCFIAADKDLEVTSLPNILDQKISSYRIFKWYDASKKALATADNDFAICTALNVTSTYTWGKGNDMAPDVESIPHHIKENWPTAGELGTATWSPHMKTNNEPQNTADDPYVKQSLNEILANWEALMATGMRLCSPSSWDGSDYWNGTGFLKEFFDSIDARGWRCDIVDLHCYWPKDNFGNIKNWYDAVSRPVWVSEWVWGASWGRNNGELGAFANGITEAQNAASVKEICEKMNGMPYVERYYYWNNERDISKVYRNGKLTPAGEYYAAMDPGLAYKPGVTNYVPKAPTMRAPTLTAMTAAGKISLKWKEAYGELTQSMVLEYSSNGSDWETVETYEPNEQPQTYIHDASKGAGQYRVHTTDFLGKQYTSAAVSVSGSSYFLYNVGAQQWLCSGSSWGTHAMLTPNGGVDVLVEEAGNGKYTIDTQLVNGDNHYLNILENDPWVDQTPGLWTFTETGDGTYRLTCNGKNLVYDSSSSSLKGSSETGPNAQWIFQTRDDRIKMLEQATSKNPVDATFFIVDNELARYNETRRAMWQGNPTWRGYEDGSSSNYCLEKFNCTFDVYQEFSGAPAGNYQLRVQGFYRNGGYADAAEKHNNGTEGLYALLYANNNSQPLQSIFTEAGKLDVGVITSDISGKFPDSMTDAARFFAAGLYDDNVLEFTLGEGEDLRIGIKKTNLTDKDWAIFDNFRLIYLGLPPVPNDLTGDREVDANDVRALVSYLLGSTSTPKDFNLDAADINEDGEVNISDVTALIAFILNIESLPASSDQTTGEASSNQSR